MEKRKLNYTISVPKDLKLKEPGNKNTGQLVRIEKKVYPNDACTCGSGLKAKKCCYRPYSL